MIISPHIHAFERPVVMPLLFPECVPAKDVNHIIQLPEPVIPLPPFPKLLEHVPAEALSLPGIADTASGNGQFPSPHIYRVQPESIAEITEVVERTPNRIVEILELEYFCR